MNFRLDQKLQEAQHIFLWSHSNLNQIRKCTMQKGFFRQNMRSFFNHFRDRRQITFVTLKKFCPLSISTFPTPCSQVYPELPTPENITLDGIPSKFYWKIHDCFHFRSNFEVTSYKKIQLPVVYFYRLLHEQIPFFTFFSSSLNTICKKIFVTNFHFF